MGPVLALLAVPPLSMAGAWALALLADRRGDCRRCGRWPPRRHPPEEHYLHAEANPPVPVR